MNKHGGYHGENPDILDFSVNINPMGMPEKLKEKLFSAFGSLEKYPEITGKSQIKKLGEALDLDTKHLILGNGAIELIYLFARSQLLLNKKKKALIIQPTFNEYERALKLYGWDVFNLVLKNENNFKIQKNILLKKIEDCSPEVIFLCNPNNPTGVVYTQAFIKDLVNSVNKAITWFIDESFIDFSSEEDSLDLIKEEDKSLFLLRSLTKFYGLPGLRIGYGLGTKKIINEMEAYKEPWTINALGLVALGSVYDEIEYRKTTKEYIEKERTVVYNKLKKFSFLKVFKSDADFHLCQLIKGQVSDLKEDLEKMGIFIRTCEDFRGLDESYFRIAIKTKENNDYLINCLNQWRE